MMCADCDIISKCLLHVNKYTANDLSQLIVLVTLRFTHIKHAIRSEFVRGNDNSDYCMECTYNFEEQNKKMTHEMPYKNVSPALCCK